MRPLLPCFQCGDSVLDLRGQDIVLPTYLLRPEPSRRDQEVLEARAYGYVHLRCFVGSRWARLWAERIRENLEGVRLFPVVFESDGLVLLRHEVLSIRDTIVIGTDGYYASFGDVGIRARRPTPGGALIPVRHEFNLEVTGWGAFAEDIVRALQEGRSYPLLGLIEGLGLRHRLWSEAAVVDGRLEPRPGVEEDDDDGELWIEAVALYDTFVPDHVLSRVLDVLPDHRSRRRGRR